MKKTCTQNVLYLAYNHNNNDKLVINISIIKSDQGLQISHIIQ